MKLYNSLTRRIEEFKPINASVVGMYSCGPTVYDHTHLGHMRTYVNTDVLRRALEYSGFKVKQVMNITDVGHLVGDQDMGEDKMEVAQKREKKSAWEIAKIYEKEFFETTQDLNVLKPNVSCRATNFIKEMIALVEKIEKNGFTYKTTDGVYFDTSQADNYAQLSHMPLEKLREGARVEKNPEKKNPTDFALWKFSPKDGTKRQMEWSSPWGVGFPGWHLECSAMGMKCLGERFDVHTGGVDHITIHHTNEIAQNQAATGHRVVNLWFHNEFLLVDGGKMSKSKGNFYTLVDLEKKGFEPLALRYLFLTAHYRQTLNFTWQSLRGAQVALERLKEAVHSFEKGGEGETNLSPEKLQKVSDYQRKFLKALSDDLKTPEVLSVVWEVVKSNVPSHDKRELLLDFDQVLGLGLAETPKAENVPLEVSQLARKRENLRKAGKWEEADTIREEIEKLGYLIKDTLQGSMVKKK